MASAIDVLGPAWVEVEGTEFYIQPLSGIEMLEVTEKVSVNEDGSVLIGAAVCRLFIQYGLKGWKNFNDKDGAVVYGRSQSMNINRLPMNVIKPLALEIMSRSQIGEEEEKK